MPFQVAAFNQLYQHWCLLCVVDSLQDPKIGFVIQKHGSLDPFYELPLENAIFCQLIHPKFPGLKVDIWNERRYPFYSKRKRNSVQYGYMDNDRKRGGVEGKFKHRPDISIEIWHNGFTSGQFPQIVTLDPTITKGRQESLERKYLYLDNIRCFDSRRDYRNGEALHLVRAAWAIFPGRNRRHESIEARGSARRGRDEEFSAGNICLFPGNEGDLVDSLKDILQYTVLDGLKLSL